MDLSITLTELLAWTAEERAKWLPWFKQNPAALDVAVQPDGRFATVSALLDHIFLVEVRHTRRLQRLELPGHTGVATGDIDGLFGYADRGRSGVHDYIATLTPQDAATPREVVVQSGGSFSMTPRKLLFHMTLHEVRHWAQIASAVRMAGFAPPGDHDLFYSKALV